MKKSILTVVALSAMLVMGGCSSDDEKTADSSTGTESTESETVGAAISISDGTSGDEGPEEGTIYMKQLYTAPHGTRSFAAVNVLMNGETILAARIEEFQYVSPDDFEGVPNSDGKFGESYPKDMVLASKADNNEAYSALMEESGGATQTWADSMKGVTDFAVGKTARELESSMADIGELGEDGDPSEVVTGATFTDTSHYIQAIVDCINRGMVTDGIETSATDFAIAQKLGSPHGDRSFSLTTVAMEGDKLAAVFLDEFQYADPADFGGVPNSDNEFGKDIKDDQVLISKEANDEMYSNSMTENGEATQTWKASMKAISAFAVGKTAAEIEEAVKKLDDLGEDGNVADVVTGATFSDTGGYLQAIADAMKEAKE